MTEPILSKEQRILRVLRQVLAQIVKDVTPAPGQDHPLKDSTIRDIRDLFGLIAEREAELAREAGLDLRQRPQFADAPRKSSVVRLHRPATRRDDSKDGE